MKYIFKVFFMSMLFLLFCNTASSANSFLVHIDKPFYTAGETVWFKVYYPETIDKVAIKILLVDEEDVVIQEFFQQSTNSNFLAGYVSLPYNYSTGMYRLLFNSNQELAEGSDKFSSGVEKEITLTEIYFPIYNDLISNNTKITTPVSKINSEEFTYKNSLNLSTSIKQQTIRTREKIVVELEIISEKKPSAVSISAAVIPKAFYNSTELGYQYFSEGVYIDLDKDTRLGKEVYLKGTVFNKKKKPIQLNVIGAYTDKLNTMYYTKSNAEGEFTLKLPNFYQKQSIQFLSYEKEIDDFLINTLSHHIPDSNTPTLMYTDDIETMLERSKKRKKLEQYYDHLDDGLKIENQMNNKGYSKSDINFKISDYEKFEEVYDFFSELITPLQFKKVKGEMVATMSNPKATHAVNSTLKGSPLFIVDGKATRNANYAGQLKMSNIESVELFYSPDELRKQFNVLGSSGVVRINTITPLFDIPEADIEDVLEINGLHQDGSFVPYSPETTPSNLPQFYSTIYWNPDVKMGSSGKANFSFFHSDDIGEFKIIIVADDAQGNRSIEVLDYLVSSL